LPDIEVLPKRDRASIAAPRAVRHLWARTHDAFDFFVVVMTLTAIALSVTAERRGVAASPGELGAR
jgi:hypothetical protein